ncbi:MAG: type I methionyl aminopeptidase [Alphaproteobacteria bacterium]|nr:type I methionyl aminopeptidase [Alphaproteobacteria bacterium]
MIAIKAPWEIPMMRTSGRLLAEVISVVREMVAPGVTTLDLDRVCEEEIRKRRARPAFKGYVVDGPPFPATVCASPNEQIVHGIPNKRPLEEGDLLSLDFGLEHGGYFADSAFSVSVGAPKKRVAELLDATEQSLYEAVSRAVPGARVGDIGHCVQGYVEAKGFNVVRDLVGHGIGRSLHEAPSVPNYGKKGTGVLLKAGMCLAIEPMVTMGSYRTRTLKDRWTVVTADGSLAAHFEHTVLITPQGPEILTRL